MERREGRRRGKRTERGGCSRLLVRRLESREAKAKEDSRASIALRRLEQLATCRSLCGAGWRSCTPPSVPLLSDSFFVVGALWSLPTLLGASTAERTEQHRRRCLARGLPRLAKLGLLLGATRMSPPSRPLMSDSYFVVGALGRCRRCYAEFRLVPPPFCNQKERCMPPPLHSPCDAGVTKSAVVCWLSRLAMAYM